jgi:7,8-dihydropterin-6-yl-methyl-4-(beta-D-ribofuranosyl)aminobenzene 5'-phosphate synthase
MIMNRLRQSVQRLGFVLASLVVVLLLPCLEAAAQSPSQDTPIRITVLFDNYSMREDLPGCWGFSCLVEGFQKTILFDTGSDGRILLDNMAKLKINPKDIDAVVLSHPHDDHVSGCFALLQAKPGLPVYVGPSFPEPLLSGLRDAGGEIRIEPQPVEICPKVRTSGEIGGLSKEQALILETPRGLVVLVGCAHPGIIEMLGGVRRTNDRPFFMVLGGFHLTGQPDVLVDNVIREFRALGVSKVGPSHCTGDLQIEKFRKAYGVEFVPLGVGAVIEVK